MDVKLFSESDFIARHLSKNLLRVSCSHWHEDLLVPTEGLKVDGGSSISSTTMPVPSLDSCPFSGVGVEVRANLNDATTASSLLLSLPFGRAAFGRTENLETRSYKMLHVRYMRVFSTR